MDGSLTRLVDALPRLCLVVRDEDLSLRARPVAAVVEEGVGDVVRAAEEALVAVVADVQLPRAVAGAEGVPIRISRFDFTKYYRGVTRSDARFCRKFSCEFHWPVSYTAVVVQPSK